MKRLLLVLIILIAGKIHAAPCITIGDLDLFLAYAPADSPISLREYLPEGETLDKWNRMASIRVFSNLKNPKKYLAAVAKTAVNSHPAARAVTFQNEKTKDLVLDFMVFSPISAKLPFWEWNLMRATYVKGKGLVVYQYAMRGYNIKKELAVLVLAEREKMLNPFMEASFEEKETPDQRQSPGK